MTTKNITLSAVVALAAMKGIAESDVIYQNDFSMRTSAHGVPTSRWQSQSYTDGDLCRTPGEGAVVMENNYQDGWHRGLDGNHTAESYIILHPLADSDDPALNRCVIFINPDQDVRDPSKDHRTHVVQAFGNVITSGVLRMQVDLHAVEYNCNKNNNFFVGPLYKKYLDVNWGASLPKYAGFFGFNNENGVVKTYYYGGNGGSGSTYVGSFESKVSTGNWYRFVIDFDMDKNEFGGEVYAMGAMQPELTTPNGPLLDKLPPVHFYSDRGEDTGGVAGIVLRDCGSVSTSRRTDRNRAPAVDNIRLLWRASGSDFGDDDLFYENDFNRRRFRALEPAPSMAATYETVKTFVDDTFTGYSVNEIDNLPGNLLLAGRTSRAEAQPYGIDGWRRINWQSCLEYSVARYTKGGANPMLAVTGASGLGNRFALAALNLGGKISSGQVELRFDVRTPDKMRNTNTPYIYGMLAPEEYLNSGTDDPQSRLYAGRSGLIGANESSTFQFAVMGSEGTDAGYGAVKSHWYRVVQIVDLGTKKFDTVIYDIGEQPVAWDGTVSSEPVFTRSGTACKNQSLSDVACVAFFIGGAGGETGGTKSVSENEAGIIYLDNICVLKRATAQEEWTKVYFNDFSTRVRYNMPKTSFALASNPDMPGEDGWVMRRYSFGKPTVFGSVNPALGVDNSKGMDFLWAVQSIGGSVVHGRIQFCADFRPPREWTTHHGIDALGSVMLGTDTMFMGNRYETGKLPDSCKQYQIRFGVGPKNSGWRHYRIPDNKLFYTNGNGTKVFFDSPVDWTHWYRFVAKSDVRAGTFDLKVYDMGTVHPDVETPTPQRALASVKNVAYRTPLASGLGLSSIGISILANEKETPWTEFDDGLCYVDNIQVRKMRETVIVVR